MNQDNFRLGKEYKLCSQKIIDAIFEDGDVVKEYPFFVRYKIIELPTKASFQFVISAPKKKNKLAVDRNRIKRICKEVIRLNKTPIVELCSSNNIQLALFIVYTGEELRTEQLGKKYAKFIDKLINQVNDTFKNKK